MPEGEIYCQLHLTPRLLILLCVSFPCTLICRHLATVAAIDKELQAREDLQAEIAKRPNEAITQDQLIAQRQESASLELPASLEVMTIQSYLVEAEVRSQRVLQLISSMPAGFDR